MRIKAILVDNEGENRKQFVEANDRRTVDLAGIFESPKEALLYAETNPVDCAFLEIELPEMNGIVLGRKLREKKQDMILIYVSARKEYLGTAIFQVRADYFLLKPCGRKEIQEVLHRAEYLAARLRKRVEVKTFGNFDVYIDGKVLVFTNQKAKELFAVCIDNEGGAVSMRRAVDVLWEDRNYDEKVKGLYRKAVAYLKRLFREYHVEEIFESSRGSCHINRQEITCDYYEILDGKRVENSSFDGRYMSDYSWAEETCGRLNRIAQAE